MMQSTEVMIDECRKANVRLGLRQYLTLKALEQVDCSEGEYTEADSKASQSVPAPRPYDREIKVGQVRTIPSTVAFKNLVVLSKWDEGSWLVAPFSRLDHPLGEHEVKLSGLGRWATVVMGQLAATVATESLEESWVLGELSETDMAFALAAVHGWMGSADPVLEMPIYQMSTGLPIHRSDDPRLQHTQDELDAVQPFYSKDLALQLDDDGIDMPEDEPMEQDPELARKGRNPRKEPDV